MWSNVGDDYTSGAYGRKKVALTPTRTSSFLTISLLLLGAPAILFGQAWQSPDSSGEIENLIRQGDIASAQTILSKALKRYQGDASITRRWSQRPLGVDMAVIVCDIIDNIVGWVVQHVH